MAVTLANAHSIIAERTRIDKMCRSTEPTCSGREGMNHVINALELALGKRDDPTTAAAGKGAREVAWSQPLMIPYPSPRARLTSTN